MFVTDPDFGAIETPHGQVRFLQLFGITTAEYNNLKSGKDSTHDLIKRHLATNPLLITDLGRK